MKISFGSWAFTFGPRSRDALSFQQSAQAIADAGYDGVEISGFPPHVTLEEYASKNKRLELVRTLSGMGLGVSAYVADFTSVNPIARENAAAYLDRMARCIDLSAAIGCAAIRLDSVAAPEAGLHHSALQRLTDIWREAAERAAQSSIRLVWEFEPAFAFNKPSDVVSIYEKVGHPAFQVLFDTAHAYLCGVAGARQQGRTETIEGGVAGFLDLLCGRIGHVHIVDTDGTLYGEETSTHCPLGEGLLDFHALAPALRSVPGIEWWCVDLSFCKDTEKHLKPCLQFARALSAS